MSDDADRPAGRASPTPIRFQVSTRRRLDEHARRTGLSRNRLVELAVRRLLDDLAAEDG